MEEEHNFDKISLLQLKAATLASSRPGPGRRDQGGRYPGQRNGRWRDPVPGPTISLGKCSKEEFPDTLI